MKIEKTIKRIRKTADKDPKVKMALVDTVGGVTLFRVVKKNRQAFRFFKTIVTGEQASAVDYVYGIGGSMDVKVGDDFIEFNLFTDSGKKYDSFIIEEEAVYSL